MLVIAGLFLSSTYSAIAVIPEWANFIVLPTAKVLLESKMTMKTLAKLEITDMSTDKLIYSEKLPYFNALDTKMYNLSELPSGEYAMRVKYNNMVYEKIINLDNDITSVVNETIYAKPKFNYDGNKLVIGYMNMDRAPVSVIFSYYSSDFFTDKINTLNDFTRTYNLSRLDPGDYTVELTAGEHQFYYYLKVR
jgi:hypothetical protein